MGFQAGRDLIRKTHAGYWLEDRPGKLRRRLDKNL